MSSLLELYAGSNFLLDVKYYNVRQFDILENILRSSRRFSCVRDTKMAAEIPVRWVLVKPGRDIINIRILLHRETLVALWWYIQKRMEGWYNNQRDLLYSKLTCPFQMVPCGNYKLGHWLC